MKTVAPSNTKPFTRRVRYAVKSALQKLPTERDAFVVASFGRAGSTLIYDALVEATTKTRFGVYSKAAQRIVQDAAFDTAPEIFTRGVVYKTHRYPNILRGQQNVRGIFLFGSAIDAALSVHEQKALRSEAWVKLHFDHLCRPYRYDDLLTEDVLGFRAQCISWMGCQEAPVLCMRYETLWDNVDKLAEFCGMEVTLPKRRARKPKEVAPDLLEAAQAVYGPLDEAMAKLPDCFEAAPRFGDIMKLD